MRAQGRAVACVGYALQPPGDVDNLRRGWRVRRSASAAGRVGIRYKTGFSYARSAKARALLDDPVTATRWRRPGARLRLSLKVSTNEFIRLQATCQQDIKQVGIRARRRSYEFATLMRTCEGNSSCSRCSGGGCRIRHAARGFHSKRCRRTDSIAGIREAEVDSLIDARCCHRRRQRRRFYGEAQRAVAAMRLTSPCTKRTSRIRYAKARASR